ncbi:MAG: BspA family leucine-rich repeat surface protein [Mangrovibacterium sp.]
MRRTNESKVWGAMLLPLLVMLLILLMLFSACRHDDFQNDNRELVQEESEMSIDFSTRGGISSEVASSVLSNVRLFTSQQSTDLMDAELYNITRDVENSKLNAKVKTGDWDVTLVSALGDFSVETFYTSQTASAQTMFRYSPAEIIGMGHESAPQLFTGYETNVPTIMADQTESITSEMARNVSKVQVIVKNIIGNIDFNSGEHEVRLHHVPSRIAYDGCLLPNATTPDTLAGHIYRSLPLFASPDEHGDLADTLDFIIPAHRGDFSSDESEHNSHKMKISVRMKCLDGSFYESEAEIPLVARCNEILRLNLTISSALEIEAGIHPWIESEHDLELVQTAFTVSKSTVRMQTADKIWASSNDPITLDTSDKADWLTLTPNADNTKIELTANFDTYSGTARSTFFTLKSGRLEKRIYVEQLVSGDFISIWRTTAAGETVKLPIVSFGEYDCTVDWGDGSTPTYLNTTDISHPSAQHTYAESGEHTVTISGKFKGIGFYSHPGSTNLHAQQMVAITNWGCLELDPTMGSHFAYSNIESIDVADEPNLAGVTNMNGAFLRASKFDSDISSWDMTHATSMIQMFQSASKFNNGGQPLSWGKKTRNVTNMKQMFHGAFAFNQEIGDWNVSSVTDMSSMFYAASAFNQDISDWDMSKVTDTRSMFESASKFNNGGQPLSWGEGTNKIVYTDAMFKQASEFNQPIGDWNVSSVKSTGSMFREAYAFNQPIGDWNVSAVNGMSYMFYLAYKFNQPLKDWDVSAVESMERMFSSASAFNQPIGGWDVSAVTSMERMFSSAYYFNQPLKDWDVSAVDNMSGMFASAYYFNQPIGGWDVSAVDNMAGMFSYANAFNQPIGDWDVSLVEDMGSMFNNASAFDQDLSAWKINSLTGTSANNGAASMLNHSALSTDNYDKLLISWHKQVADGDAQGGVTLGAVGVKYCAAAAAHQELTGTYGWTINDAGQDESCASSVPFVTVWSGSFTILGGGLDYDFSIKLYDNSTGELLEEKEGLSISYSSSAFTGRELRLEIYPQADGSGFPTMSTFQYAKLLRVVQWGDVKWQSMAMMFAQANSLTHVPGATAAESPDLSECTSLASAFLGCMNFNSNINGWDVSSVEDMSGMFWQATQFNQPLNNWDVSSVKNMSGMFEGAYSFNQSLNNWDVSSVTDMSDMFRTTSASFAFNQPLDNWDVSSVEDMSDMFAKAKSFDQDLSNWKINALTNATGMLNSTALSIDNYDKLLISWHEQVKNGNAKSGVSLGAQSTKYCAAAAAHQELTGTYGWTINDAGQDAACKTFGGVPFVSVWKNGRVKIITIAGYEYSYDVRVYSLSEEIIYEEAGVTGDFSYTTPGKTDDILVEIYPKADGSGFPRATMESTILRVEQWGNVKWQAMENMFRGCGNLTSVPGATAAESPDLSECTSLQSIFRDCMDFNSDISGWDVSKVEDMSGMFEAAKKFNNGNQPLNWGEKTQNVKTMQYMFSYASSFNQDISDWNVSALMDMRHMFENALKFNQDLSGWDVSGVIAPYRQDYSLGAENWHSSNRPNFTQ